MIDIGGQRLDAGAVHDKDRALAQRFLDAKAVVLGQRAHFVGRAVHDDVDGLERLRFNVLAEAVREARLRPGRCCGQEK